MVGESVGHYRVLSDLGKGGMGRVFLAEDCKLGRKVALKFLPEDLQDDPSAKKRFALEAQAAAALDHPFICKVYETGDFKGQLFIAMEFVRGETLRGRLSQGPLPVREALRIGVEVAEAVEEAHQAGILHRDLKPANIMCSISGHVKVMDFGLVKLTPRASPEKTDASTTLTADQAVIGTLPYMAPEQLRGESATPQSDIFSLGIVLYEMLSGEHPFGAGSSMMTVSGILRDPPPPLARKLARRPPGLESCILAMLDKDPSRRLGSMGELRHRLGELMAEPPVEFPPPSSPLPELEAKSRNLRELIDLMGIIPESLLRDLAFQVALQLRALHRENRAHGALRPESIVVSDEEVLLLPARPSSEPGRKGWLSSATEARYRPPERLAAQASPASDLYSLGLILLEAATGGASWTSSQSRARSLGASKPRIGRLNPQISPFFEGLVAALTAADPQARPTASQLCEILEKGEESEWWAERQKARWHPDFAYPRRVQKRRGRFVDREAELQRLQESYELLKSGSGNIVVVDGEAGIGKSHLLDHFLRELEERGERVNLLFCSHGPGLGAGATALSGAVVDYFGEANLGSALSHYLKVSPEVVEGFAAFLAGRVAGPAAPTPSTAVLQTLFSRLAEALGRERPTIWLVEDLHFASAGSRAFLLALARDATRYPLLLVLTARTLPAEFLAELGRLDTFARISLPRLSESDVLELLGEEIKDHPELLQLREKIVSKSNGNPYFEAELVRNFKENPEAWLEEAGSADSERSLTVPSSLRALVLARLKQLKPEEKTLLEVGAVQGFRFDPDLVGRALGLRRLQVLQTLAGVEQGHGLIRAAGRQFEFDHHQVQEVLHNALPQALREEYDLLLASAFEEREGISERPPEQIPEEAAVFLTQHYLRGNRPLKCRDFFSRALRYLQRQYRFESFLEISERILEEFGDDLRVRCDVRCLEGQCLTLLGRGPDAIAAIEDALAAARASADEGLVLKGNCLLVDTYLNVSDFEACQKLAETALHDARRIGDLASELRLVFLRASALVCSGRFREALELYQQLLVHAQKMNNPYVKATTLLGLGTSCMALNRAREARESLTEALELSGQIQSGELECSACYGMVQHAKWHGRYDEALHYGQRQLARSREMAYRFGEALALMGLGTLAYEEGRLGDARELLQETDHHCTAIQQHHVRALGLGALGDVLAALGEEQAALERYQESERLHRKLGTLQGLAEACTGLGRHLLGQGNRQAAIPLLEEAAQLCESHSMSIPGPLPAAYLASVGQREPSRVPVSLTGRCSILAETHLALGQAGAGLDHLRSARSYLEKMSAHLRGDALDCFWSGYPVARRLRALESKAADRRSAGDQ